MNKMSIPLLVGVVMLTAGCKNRLVFVTQTSVGLDISGTANYPNKIAFSYSRYEGAIVPRKSGGSNESHSVFGGMDSDVSFALPPQYRIEQLFATGEAAILAAQRAKPIENQSNCPAATPCEKRHPGDPNLAKDLAPLIFLTGTTFGIHFTAGEQELNPTALIGYRRREATIIPIVDRTREARSVYADIHLSSGETDAVNTWPASDSARRTVASTNRVSQWGGVKIRQSFATGAAAEALARKPAVQNKLAQAAGAASISEFRSKASLETEIEKQLNALSAEKQKDLYTWADNTFPAESGGQLVQKSSVGYFTNSFLPKLDLEKTESVLNKLKLLEAQ